MSANLNAAVGSERENLLEAARQTWEACRTQKTNAYIHFGIVVNENKRQLEALAIKRKSIKKARARLDAEFTALRGRPSTHQKQLYASRSAHFQKLLAETAGDRDRLKAEIATAQEEWAHADRSLQEAWDAYVDLVHT